MKRLRIVAYLVQPQVMVDDGENLSPLNIQPVSVPAADWTNVVALVAGATEQLRQQVEGLARVTVINDPTDDEAV